MFKQKHEKRWLKQTDLQKRPQQKVEIHLGNFQREKNPQKFRLIVPNLCWKSRLFSMDRVISPHIKSELLIGHIFFRPNGFKGAGSSGEDPGCDPRRLQALHRRETSLPTGALG